MFNVGMSVIPSRLIREDLALSELSVGCAQLGNLYREVSDSDALATVERAWQLGIRAFDTAPHYGLGLSERRLGAALRSRPRDAYVVSSKVGRLLEPVDRVAGLNRRRGIHGAGDAPPSLRLQPRRDPPFPRPEASSGSERIGSTWSTCTTPTTTWPTPSRTGYPTLAELRQEGVVRAIGAGMNDAGLLARLVRETDVDVVMLAGRYTLLEQESLDDLLPLCLERGVAVVAAGVFNSGLLAQPRPRPNAKYNYTDAPADVVQRAQAIATVCERHGTSLPAAALAFPLAHPAVVSVCVGARSAAQIEQNVALYSRPVASDLWEELKAKRLLREDAPAPEAYHARP